MVDASIVTILFTKDVRHAAARTLVERETDLYAPALILTETANALWQVGRMSAREGVLDLVKSYVVSDLANRLVLIADAEVLAFALELAFELSHPVYDCTYLALALQRDEPLYTFDLRFKRKLDDTRFAPNVRVPQGP